MAKGTNVFMNTCTVTCDQCESMMIYVGIENATISVPGNILVCRKCGKEHVFDVPEEFKDKKGEIE